MDWLRRLRALFRRGAYNRELDEEMRFHLDMQAEDNRDVGMDADEARYAARRQFGNSALLKESSREAWGWAFLEQAGRDLKFALRTLRRAPGFATVVVTILALGIGANTAIFSVLDTVLLRALPIRQPGELMFVQRVDRRESVSRFSYPAFRELRDKCASFSGLFALAPVNSLAVRGSGPGGSADEAAQGQLVSGEFFGVLGVRALIGRMLGPEDDRVPGQNPVAVISYGYWERRWARDPTVIGRTLIVNGVAFSIVGVTPPEFFGVVVGRPADLWVPAMMQADLRYRSNYWSTGAAQPDRPWLNQPDIAWLTVMGRVPSVVAAARAAAEASALYRQLESARGRGTPELHIALAPGSRGISDLRRRFSEPLSILMGMVVLLLLIACANVANLLLARSAARRQEVAIRLAIGAGRARLLRQLLTESLVLALAGGALGVLFAEWGRRALLALLSLGFGPLGVNVSIDLRVLVFTTVLSMATGILFGLAPAIQATSQSVGVRRSLGARLSVSRLLAVSQVALSMLLLIGAGLFTRTLRNLHARDTGYRGDDLLLVEINPRALGYQSAQLRDLYDRLLERARAIPGIRLASLSLSPPVSGDQWTSNVTVAGYPARPDENLDVQKLVVTQDYFETVGLRLIEGRGFTAHDVRNASPVAVINETMASYFFGKRSAIGQRFVFGGPLRGSGIEIVGVVRDAVYNRLRDRTPRVVYLPVAQQIEGATFHGPVILRDLEVRTVPGAASAVAAPLRQVIAATAPNLPVIAISTLTDRIDHSLGQERAIAQLTGFFGALALLLAAIGLYGLMSYVVARRTSEIGVRMALGALPKDVRGLILRETLALTAGGIALGLPAALLSLRLVSSQLFGLSPHDPGTILTAILVMTAAAVLSGYVPARRATRVDPMEALRYE